MNAQNDMDRRLAACARGRTVPGPGTLDRLRPRACAALIPDVATRWRSSGRIP